MNGKKLLAIAALTAAGCLAGAPGLALAQGNTWAGANLSQMIEGARWRVGIIRLNAAFELSNAGYDSDIYYGYFSEPVPDLTLSAGLPVQVLLPLSKKVVLDLSDTPRYQFYFDAKKERAWNNTFQGRVHFALDKLYVQAGAGIADNKMRISPELDINIRQKRDSLNGLVLWQVSKSASLALLYGGVKYDYGDAEFLGTNIAGRLNRTENFFDLVTYVQPSPRTRFFVNGRYGTYVLTGTTISFEDARSYSVFGGVEFIPRVGEVLKDIGVQGSVRLGYTRLDIGDPSWEDGSGFAGEADVSIEIMKKTTARVFFSRGFQFSIYSGGSYYLSTGYGAGLSRLLSRKTTLSYDISFSRNSYPTEDGGGGEAPQGVYNLYTTHMFSFDIRLARHLGITFLGTLANRRFDREGPARRHYFLGFSLVYGFSGSGMSAPTGG